ncbi:MAG: peptide ABC transporter substrate-binding protein [Alphaproteobacteria bacterium]|nr:peptide ABC transporter substrate-binding protein [Alphaproteobacteria bacterium]
MSRALRFLRALLLLVAAVAAAPAYAAGPTLVRANGNEPGTLDPQKYMLLSEDTILRDLFEGLTTQDENNRFVAGAAESWVTSDDGLVWTFKLRPGLTWSDGVPLTAEDFVAGMRRAVDPKTGAPYAPLALKLLHAPEILAGKMPPESLGVEAPDATTVIVKLAVPSPLVPYLLSQPIFSPVPRHALAARGDDWIKPGVMVSNGAYALAQWDPSVEVRLKRNPHFHAVSSVHVAEVVFLPSDDEEMALRRYRAGEIDVLPAIPVAKLEWALRTVPDQLSLLPVTQIRYLEINHTRGKLKDVRVRRALAMAIDRDTLAGRLMYSAAIPAYGIAPREEDGYRGADFDFANLPEAARLAEAQRLLAEAGYGKDNPLVIELRSPADAWAKSVAVAITAMWQKAGVQAEARIEEARSHYAAVRQGDFDIAMTSLFASNDPEQFFWLFQTGNVMNASGFSDPEFDRLSLDAEATMELTPRYRRFAEAEAVLDRQVAAIPLFWTLQATLIAERVKGLQPTPTGLTRSRYATLAP